MTNINLGDLDDLDTATLSQLIARALAIQPGTGDAWAFWILSGMICARALAEHRDEVNQLWECAYIAGIDGRIGDWAGAVEALQKLKEIYK